MTKPTSARHARDLIFVTLSVGETIVEKCRGCVEGVGAMAATAATTTTEYIVLVSPYNIDLQRRDVAGARGPQT